MSRGGMSGPSIVEFKGMRFLITDRPTTVTIPQFIKQLKNHGATDLIRVCEPSYEASLLVDEGIKVTDWPFEDGGPPPPKVVQEWFDLLIDRFAEKPGCCVAIHCVAGLGRAPVLVALALMEAGMKYEDAVKFIREKRRGAINSKQLSFLEHYRPKRRLKSVSQQNGGSGGCCMQ
ncbi:uncharacterized protein TRIADDRAFT_27879 [Trichoplax adhaerens]|uniref:Protein tyrosine phosphatase type IVA 3 n=1 Tax=Trichoplax adhaerens TaxID=10228 RepID=B3S204_TRIAD|nr:hypothetical protein TRIADDRAFT_27879 [Trichoplax adhaerens]EDV23597.1 hypothetical protein TRIADDRAFT_27879 [Trichoplax adhaerens]|eukprot:XP_002114507.1 hypothetical protein TRIADDRAFT_27879 [Trichoplax adhaerens]